MGENIIKLKTFKTFIERVNCTNGSLSSPRTAEESHKNKDNKQSEGAVENPFELAKITCWARSFDTNLARLTLELAGFTGQYFEGFPVQPNPREAMYQILKQKKC